MKYRNIVQCFYIVSLSNLKYRTIFQIINLSHFKTLRDVLIFHFPKQPNIVQCYLISCLFHAIVLSSINIYTLFGLVIVLVNSILLSFCLYLRWHNVTSCPLWGKIVRKNTFSCGSIEILYDVSMFLHSNQHNIVRCYEFDEVQTW